MRDEGYDYVIDASFTSYEFESEGPKGIITKLIKYTEIDGKGFFNLGFGDKIDGEDDFDDTIITDNKDSMRILATVAATVSHFLEHYPSAYVYATGSNKARTRLYRIGLSNNLEQIEEDFLLLGNINDKWEKFKKNRDYSAFLIKKK